MEHFILLFPLTYEDKIWIYLNVLIWCRKSILFKRIIRILNLVTELTTDFILLF